MDESQTEAPLRRRPRQARGQERVAAIVAAAEQIFAEHGYEAGTTNAIAAHAGVPIGSVYQYFANKTAILHAITTRYRAIAGALFDAALADADADTALTELVDRLLGVMLEFGAIHVGFTRLVLQSGAHPDLRAAAAALQADVTERVETLLAERAPHMAPERRALTARVALTVVFALLSVLISEKAQGQAHVDALIEETRRLLLAYLRAAASDRVTG